MYLGASEIIDKKRAYMIPCSYHFYKNPPQLVKGEMQFLFDSTGKKYLDFFAGVSVMSCGHANPAIIEKTIEQLKTLQHTTSIYLTEPIVLLAEKLAGFFPEGICRSFFCNSGSEANEGAILTARLYTKRSGIIGLKNGLHGRTHLTMGVTGIEMWRTSPTPCEDTYIVENYFPNEEQCLSEIEQFILKGNIAAVIAEPMQGNGGMIVPSVDFFKKLVAILKPHGVLLIADEIQTGFGRTGKMFAIEHFGVTPDIITTAKALGNGMPISCFATTDAIGKVFTNPSASTFGGNPVSSVTALAVLQFIQENNLIVRANTLGTYLRERLMDLKNKTEQIVSLRGLGLMQGIELKSPEITDIVLEEMMERGIIVGKNGITRNVLAMQPPLIIEKSDIDFFVDNLEQVICK